MISDVSSVVPDFLYSGKPYGLVSMSFTIEEFVKAFPLAEAAYVIGADLANLDAMLDELLVSDTKSERRRAMRTYYLGPFAPENYADAFVDAARNIVLHERKPVAALQATAGDADEGAEDLGPSEAGAAADDEDREDSEEAADQDAFETSSADEDER